MNTSPIGTGARVLIIGCGNPLRGDDGAGWHAATLLARGPRLAGADVLARHQLTPELAEDIAHAHLVVLIDACSGGTPGTVSVRRIEPGYPPAPTWPLVPTWSHHLDPTTLVHLTKTLYGASPPVFLVAVTGAFFGYRDRLSPAVRRALPSVREAAQDLIDRSGSWSGPHRSLGAG
ncbi:MAG: hydrogenase maturation protease [Actinomycetota bacterium]|nr:hydrogenase maturation protease [Actinomycetota bacterium]